MAPRMNSCPRCKRHLMTAIMNNCQVVDFCYACQLVLTGEETPSSPVTENVTRYHFDPNALVELFERKFEEHCPDLTYQKEVKVAPGRRMRWDYVVENRVAIEVDGMAHRTRERFWSDTVKHNVAMMEGWTWLRCNRALLSDELQCLTFFAQLKTLVNMTAERKEE